MLNALGRTLLILFPLSELYLSFRWRSRGASSRDGGSLGLLWGVFALAITGAIWLAPLGVLRLPLGDGARVGLAAAVMAAGLALRWVAIGTLGRFFTVDVAIHPEHTVVRTGPYAWVRHPSYTGLLLTFLGLGLRLGNGLSLAVLMVPITLVLWLRILREEAALREALGAPYEDYCRATKRLVPGLL